MSMIDVFNKAVPSTIDKSSSFYETWIGKTDFTPELIVDESSDYNCGAVCNELEFVRTVSDYHVESFDIDSAEGENLDAVVLAVVELPRNNEAESDASYRRRFRLIVNQKVNPRRTTRGAIIDALSYYVASEDDIQVVEPFDTSSHYFELRLEGVNNFEDAVFLNNTEIGFIDQNFIGGPGVGEVITYVGDLIDRIKAIGVDFDVMFIEQNSVTLNSDVVIGTVQKYLNSDANVKAVLSVTKTSDAIVV